MAWWFPLEAGGVGVGVAFAREASKELMVGGGYGKPCIEVSVLILLKAGGGPGGDAAWIAEAMIVEASKREIAPLRRYRAS